MTKALETYICAFAQLALGCTFGFAMAISVAGVSHLESPFGCRACVSMHATQGPA